MFTKNRRKFIKQLAVASGSLYFSSGLIGKVKASNNLTDYTYVTTYNNYYEFGTGKNHPVERSQNFKTDPWSITIDGEVEKITLSIDEYNKNVSCRKEYIV